MNNYTIDLSLRPTTFDLWHVCLAGTAALLAIVLIAVLLSVLLAVVRRPKTAEIRESSEPEVKIVEKIVEVEKIVHIPAPEPVVLKEDTGNSALQLLGLLQKEARFVDFIQEDMSVYSDSDIGAAARVVHQGCAKAIKEHFTLGAISQDHEGSRVTLRKGFDANAYRLTGNIVGEAPFIGTLVHKGWQVQDMRLPKQTSGHNPNIIAPAEVEL